MKKFKPFLRILSDLCMICLIAWAPIWVVAIASIAFAWAFAPYYEIVVFGLASDALYGFHSVTGIIAAFLVFVAIEIIRQRTRV
jgi:hypothetical protein